MEYSKGFTLVELIIVIVIVGILSIVAVPVYKGYTKKAMGTEAKALLGSIMTAEKVYLAEYGHYKFVEDIVNYDKDLDIDTRSNKYFTGWGTLGSIELNAILVATIGNKGSGADNISMVYVTYPSEYDGIITPKAGFYEFYDNDPNGFTSIGLTDDDD